MKDHAGHTHDIVEKTASEHRNMLMKIIAPAEEMSENLSKAKDSILSTQQNIKNKPVKWIMKLINAMFSNFKS